MNAELLSCDADDFDTAINRDERETALGVYTGDLLDGFFISDTPEAIIGRRFAGVRKPPSSSQRTTLYSLRPQLATGPFWHTDPDFEPLWRYEPYERLIAPNQ